MAVPLSIIIVSYQCRELLLRCLGSLESDARRLGYEVLVVDNASTDGTAAAVRSEFSWVSVTEFPVNSGFSISNNHALAAANGEYVLLLNPDTVVPEGALPTAVAALTERPEVGMLGVKLVQENGELDHACKRGFPTPLSSLAYFTGLSRLRPRHPVLAGYVAGHVGDDEASHVDAVNGAFMLVRRAALVDVGNLDEDYWLYMEDLDWCFRFWAKGWPVLYWPHVEVMHLKGGSSGSARGWQTNRAFHRGMWIFYSKHYRPNASSFEAGAVFAAIHGKWLVSALRSALRRRLGR